MSKTIPGRAHQRADRHGRKAGPGSAVAQTAGPGRLGLGLILAASFMVVLDFSIVNVALPSIQRELGISAASVQWVVTAYAIAFGGLLILGGRAGDLYGRRRLFLAGIGVFTAASLAGGLARDPVLLIAARVVQGGGAAMVAPAALSLITTGFPEGPRRTRALGLYGATASVGFVAGQVAGGVLVEFLSWRSVFLVNVPVGLAALLLAPRVLAESRLPHAGRHLDTVGAALITVAVGALVFAVSQAGITGVGSASALIPLGLAAVAAAAFVAGEQRHADPLVRPALLRARGLRNASTLMLLLGLWNGGEMLVLSLYLQQALHMSPLAAGLAIAPQGIIGLATGLLGARLAGRLGIQRVLIVTGLAATAGFLVLTQLPAAGGYQPLLAAVMLVGFGTAGMAFGSMVTASGGIADSDQGLVGGVVNTSRQLGAALGAALLPAVAGAVDRTGHSSLAAGDRAAMLAGALAAGLATVVALNNRRKTSHTLAHIRHPAASRQASGPLPIVATRAGNLHHHQHEGQAGPEPAAASESPHRLALAGIHPDPAARHIPGEPGPCPTATQKGASAMSTTIIATATGSGFRAAPARKQAAMRSAPSRPTRSQRFTPARNPRHRLGRGQWRPGRAQTAAGAVPRSAGQSSPPSAPPRAQAANPGHVAATETTPC
jgi:EmrB/QacA subfamily drug resistance transporter